MITAFIVITLSLQGLASSYSKILDHDPWYKSSAHYWPFNAIDPNKHLTDVTGQEQSNVYGGAEPVPGVSKLALKLDGIVSTGANLGNFAGTCLSEPSICQHGFTVTFWLRFDASTISQTFYQVILQLSRTLESVGSTIYAKKNTIGFQVNDRNVSRNVEVFWNATGWVHLSLVWNKMAGSIQVLLNCKQKPYLRQTESIMKFSIIPAQNQLWLGSNYALLKNCKLEIDELGIWYDVLSEQDLCYIKNARAVDGGYSQWSKFSSCSVSCGSGRRTRERTCTNPPPKHGGTTCVGLGPSQESPSCFLTNCPIHGNYTSWSAYTPCSKSCGGGVRTRFRTCTNPEPQYRGANCSHYGDAVDKLVCNVHHCPIDGGYSQWSNYSECSVSCGDGFRTRTRSCSNPVPQYGGRNCSHLGETDQTEQCFVRICPVDGNYSAWSTFSSCSKSCGGGNKTRTRKCDNPAPFAGGRDCLYLGLPVESVVCNAQKCPINGGYTTWSTFSACSKSCQGGIQFRTRNCTNPPPQEGGMNCSRLGPPRETRSCNSDPCPVNGSYGQWNSFGRCSVTCGGGKKKRTRTCDNPKPSNGGKNCSQLGPSQETRTCNNHDCPDISFVSTMVFTGEVFRSEMYETTAEAFKEHTKKVKWNLSKLYGPKSALKKVVISFCQPSEIMINGSSGIQCKLEFRFSSFLYDGIIKLQDALQIQRRIHVMPVKSFFINSVDVPTDHKLQVKAFNTSSRSIMVTWVPSAKRENVKGYRIMYIDETGNSFSTVVSGPESDQKELHNLLVYQEYCIRVIPYSTRGDGLATFPVCAYTDYGVPSASPKNLTVEVANTTTLSVAWITPGKSVIHGTLLGYKLIYGTIDSTYNGTLRYYQMLDLVPSANQLFITGLERFSIYAVKIAAYNQKGLGKWSETVIVRTGEDVPGQPPRIINVYNTSSTTLKVTWQPIPEQYHFGQLLGYRISYKDITNTNTSDYESLDVGPYAEEADITGLNKYRDYVVQVAGFNGRGEGKPSKGVIVSTDEDVPSLSPQDLTVANISSTVLLVQWNPVPKEDHNGIILGYKVLYKISRRNTSFTIKECSARTSAAEMKKLLKFTAYDVQVLAFTSKGDGPSSDVVTATTAEDIPSQPPTFISFYNTSSSSLRVTWLHIPPQYVHGILLGYRVLYRSLNVTEDMYSVSEVGPKTAEVELKNLYKYMEYGVRVMGFTKIGLGTVGDEVIVRTDQDVPSWPPEQVTAANKTSPTKITVSWQPISHQYYIHGILLGYKVLHRAVRNPDEVLQGEQQEVVLGPNVLDVTLGNLTSYTVYSINVVAFTSIGNGAPSPTIFAETCNCPQSMYTNWWMNPPYVSYNTSGIFPFILKMVIQKCCGDCAEHDKTVINFQSSSAVSSAAKRGETQVKDAIRSTTELSFPVFGRAQQKKFNDFAFIPLVESGGTVFMTTAPEPGSTAKMVVWSVFDMWPICVVVFISAFFAGILMWILVSLVLEFFKIKGSFPVLTDCYFNTREFPISPFRGPLEGMWWAFITMTTLGFGDRVPKSFHSKTLGIVWITCGLVIVSLFMSLITTTLTTEVIGKEKMVYGSRVAAILNSSEYRLGIRMNAYMNTGKDYNNLMDIWTALKHRSVDGALIDAYAVGSRQDLFKDPVMVVSKIITHQQSSYGVVLAGDAQRLQKCFRNFLKEERAKVFHAITRNVVPLQGTSQETKDTTANLFDAESEVFQQALMWTLVLFGIFAAIFFVYELISRRCRNPNPQKYDFSEPRVLIPAIVETNPSQESYQKTREMMLQVLKEFHANCKAKTAQLRTKHRRELIQLYKMKEQELMTENKEEIDAKKTLLEGVRNTLMRFFSDTFQSPATGAPV